MKKSRISTRGIIATGGLLLVMGASGLALSTQLFTNHTNASAAIVESLVQGAVAVRLDKQGQVNMRGGLVYAGHPNTPLLIQLNANSCDGSTLYSQSQTTDAQAKILLKGGSTSTGTGNTGTTTPGMTPTPTTTPGMTPTPTITNTGNTGTTGTGTTGTGTGTGTTGTGTTGTGTGTTTGTGTITGTGTGTGTTTGTGDPGVTPTVPTTGTGTGTGTTSGTGGQTQPLTAIPANTFINISTQADDGTTQSIGCKQLSVMRNGQLAIALFENYPLQNPGTQGTGTWHSDRQESSDRKEHW